MRVKNMIWFLLAAFISPVSIFAQESENPSEREYVKLIEEGKTWEYIHRYTFWDWDTLSAFQMRFDGTEVRNGTEYHKLVYSGNLTQWKTDYQGVDSNEYIDWWKLTPYDITSQPNEINTYFLMREDGGKVYLYIRDLIEGKNNPDDQFDIYNEYENQEISDEAILYDFTKKEEESLENVLCNIGPVISEIYPLLPCCWSFQDLTVTSVLNIDLNGRKLILQDFRGPSCRKISCLEGIGAVTSGFLPYIDQSPVQASMEFSEYYLNCLYNSEEEILYKADNYVDVANIIELADVAQPTVNLAIERTDDGIKAEGAQITLYDLSGRAVASGYESVSTTSLQPGVYIAKAQSSSGISTLKIRID